DADDRGSAIADTAEPHGLADHVRIFAVSSGPETIGQHDHARRVGACVLRPYQTPEHRTQPHHVKIISADHAALHHARLAETNHGKRNLREVPEFVQGVNAVLEILNFRYGKCGVVLSAGGGALANVDEAVFVAVHQRLPQNAG